MLISKHICSVILTTMAAFEKRCKWKFEAVPGYFFDYVDAAQHEPGFRASTLPLLGLIDSDYDDQLDIQADRRQWPRLKAHVDQLNQNATASTTYKVLYITRHGLGYHNVFEAQVGRETWNVNNVSLGSSCSIN